MWEINAAVSSMMMTNSYTRSYTTRLAQQPSFNSTHSRSYGQTSGCATAVEKYVILFRAGDGVFVCVTYPLFLASCVKIINFYVGNEYIFIDRRFNN
jgi:hypothetical protein